MYMLSQKVQLTSYKLPNTASDAVNEAKIIVKYKFDRIAGIFNIACAGKVGILIPYAVEDDRGLTGGA